MPVLKNAANHISGAFRDPTTKANLVDKIMSADFSGDIRDLAFNRDLRVRRTRPNVVTLEFGSSGNSFELVVRKPRGPRPLETRAGAQTRVGRTRTIAGAANQTTAANEPGEDQEDEEDVIEADIPDEETEGAAAQAPEPAAAKPVARKRKRASGTNMQSAAPH